MALLRNRGFLLLWIGQLLGILAAWSLRTVLLIWAYQLTHSGLAVSVIGLAEAGPLVLLGPVAGVLVDRWHRAHAMAGALALSSVLVLPLLAVSGRNELSLLVLVAVAVNTVGQFFLTAVQAAVPVVVEPRQVGQANSLTSLLNSSITIVGPGAAAILFATAGPHGTVLVLAALYLVTAPVIAAVPAGRAAGHEQRAGSVGGEILDGLRYVRRSRLLVSLVAVATVAALGFGALSVLDVVFVTRALHLRSEVVGALFTASGIGELIGGLTMAVLATRLARHYHQVLGVCVLLAGLSLFVYSAAPNLWVAIGALVVTGLGFPPLIVAYMTMVQHVTKDAFMGRVNSVVNTSMGVAMILSLVASGALTDLLGVRQVIGAAALILGLSGVVSLVLIRSTPPPRETELPLAV